MVSFVYCIFFPDLFMVYGVHVRVWHGSYVLGTHRHPTRICSAIAAAYTVGDPATLDIMRPFFFSSFLLFCYFLSFFFFFFCSVVLTPRACRVLNTPDAAHTIIMYTSLLYNAKIRPRRNCFFVFFLFHLFFFFFFRREQRAFGWLFLWSVAPIALDPIGAV